ncbi:MAG: Type IIS restriction enzyme Eco57I [Methanomicrobiales archaeon 53_19]|uniref:Eco57I restriction-modification methylase domain-containing protein n=1 Tax=Methanocalculus sp. TaxID=2004547 RepID=UPI0007476981|nr:TaqI-like C-terminal specificity domain-containing protein [Methanocalculus sp.]KUL04620.1 MAG: Type IIS restriction enzyme Eco57I [Methanomicrobiales archaeon 53_19]HIJ06840.1 N-6 DNA methylase [Methanocalculus sp.]
MVDSAACPEAIQHLVERFGFHLPSYKRGQKNETELRRQFLDPFFHALGWDVDNNKGYSEAYKEVAHEEPIKIRGKTLFIDYAFRIGGQTKFIVEAKKPDVNIKDDTNAALQLRRYAWNANLKLSILTDFEEFAVYDCTIPIGKNDTAATARIAYFTFKEYPEKWGWIEEIFAQESIKLGSFDRFAESKKGKRGTARVDDAFLEDIEKWRDLLARNIALRNDITLEELNTVVQRTIDRIIFLRICEDRGIERYERLLDLREGTGIYKRLCDIFIEADDRYNSGIFYFQEERGRTESPDTLSLSITIDDKVLKEIINRLYYPESPFEFSVIPTEILGHVYEQFLGKVIRLTDGGQAKVEYKPEVRKAGGVFYTPTYIVDYIVTKTVGELVRDKTPKEVSEIKILDPACGSGSFLIGAYQYLLDWHRDWYIEHLVPMIKGKGATSTEVQALIPAQYQVMPGKKSAKSRSRTQNDHIELPIFAGGDGSVSRVRSTWQLTSAERKRILLNNIFGVDIDTQAVEVTKLSLLLKVLEGENEETISKQLKLFAERALPSLHMNIKCGNSLIGPDIYTTIQKDTQTALTDEEIRQINPFDWKREFPEIMRRGGFDAVIGNPPYVRQELLKGQKDYFKNQYAVYAGTADLYAYFIEKGISLLGKRGRFSYIVANKWMRANYGKPLRQWLKTKQIEEIVDFGDLPVFTNATTYPCIITLQSGNGDSTFNATQVHNLDFPDLATYIEENQYQVNQDELDDGGWSLADGGVQELLNKLRQVGVPLGEYVQGKIYRGILTGLNKAFVIDAEIRERLITEDPKSEEIIKPFLAGRDVKRYQPLEKKQFLILFEKGFSNQKGEKYQSKWKWMENEYPAIASYLKPFQKDAEKRWDKGEYWWELRGCDYYQSFENQKIMFPDLAERPQFTIDRDGGFYNANTCYNLFKYDTYLLGILNSNLINFYYRNMAAVYRGGYLRFFSQYVELLPIRTIDPSNPDDVARHDRIVALVERILDLNNKVSGVREAHARELMKRQIEAIDAEIDKEVYELYGLTEEEIRIVEEEIAQ